MRNLPQTRLFLLGGKWGLPHIPSFPLSPARLCQAALKLFCSRSLVEVAARFLGESAHHAAHFFLGSCAGFSKNFTNQGRKLFAAHLFRKILLQNLHLFGKRIGTLLIVASLDRTVKGFLRLLDEGLVSSATEKDSDDSSAGKVALRACGSMPNRQHNQRRSQLFHRLAREHFRYVAPLAFIAGAISTRLVL